MSSTVDTALTSGIVIDGTGQIFLDNLRCTGSESRLIDCPHNGLGNHNCDHSDDAGVRCTTGIVPRLSNDIMMLLASILRPQFPAFQLLVHSGSLGMRL